MAKPFRVLIVEDDKDARSNMVDILSLDDYQMETAGHCLPAIGLLQKQDFDAVIVDWKLPDGNGADLFPIIFKHQPKTPVIVVTGMRDFDVAVTALRQGAYDFLLKPINADALRAVVARVVERRRHINEINKAQKQLLQNERLAAIGQMMTGLAHESRNALQKCHACLTNLAFDVNEMPESLELVQKVRANLDQLNGLLEEVRDYAAPIVLEKSPTDLESIVRETWTQLVGANPESSAIQFTVELEPDFPKKFKMDRVRIGQVIWNLLENARVACGKTAGHIVVSLLKNKESISLTVRDSGQGIPNENLEKIFEPFFTTKTKGTGLGLAICQRIVQAHSGTLSAANTPDENGGAAFTMTLC